MAPIINPVAILVNILSLISSYAPDNKSLLTKPDDGIIVAGNYTLECPGYSEFQGALYVENGQLYLPAIPELTNVNGLICRVSMEVLDSNDDTGFLYSYVQYRHLRTLF